MRLIIRCVQNSGKYNNRPVLLWGHLANGLILCKSQDRNIADGISKTKGWGSLSRLRLPEACRRNPSPLPQLILPDSDSSFLRLDLLFAASAPSIAVSVQSVPLLLSSQAQYAAPTRPPEPSAPWSPGPPRHSGEDLRGLTVAPWRRGWGGVGGGALRDKVG